MARTDVFTGLSEFLAVAANTSFRAAAAELGVTPAAVSQAVRSLEVRAGMPLFQRTTRRVALTEAGRDFLTRLKPASAEIGDAFDALSVLSQRPMGNLKLSVPRIALDLVIYRLLPSFRQAFPDITLDIDVDDASVDLMAGGYDAGIRIGEFIEQDMIAVRITPDFTWSVLGAPSYFAVHGRPQTPEDLMHHECIRYRFPTARTIYRWQFTRDGREFTLDAPGGIVVNDHISMIELAKQGVGLCYSADRVAAAGLASGALEPVLQRYLPTKPGLFLYFPTRSQTQPKLRAFIGATTALLRSR